MKGKLILAFMILLATGCDKDEEIPQKKETATDLLTQKKWIIDEVISQLIGVMDSHKAHKGTQRISSSRVVY